MKVDTQIKVEKAEIRAQERMFNVLQDIHFY